MRNIRIKISFITSCIFACSSTICADLDNVKLKQSFSWNYAPWFNFLTSSGYREVSLSPDGKHLAMLNNFRQVVVSDFETGKFKILKISPTGSYAGQIYAKSPREVIWLTNDLLVLVYGTYSETVTVDGKHVADISDPVVGKINPADPESTTLVAFSTYDKNELSTVDAKTGKQSSIKMPESGKIKQYAFDRNGQLRAVTILSSEFLGDNTSITNWYKPAGDKPWEKLEVSRPGDDYWFPAFVYDDNTLLVFSNQGRDTSALFNYDISTRTMGGLLAGHPTEDITYAEWSNTGLKSFTTSGIKPHRHWIDADWEKLQAEIDNIKPDTVNILSGNPSDSVLIHSYSDVDPGRWYTFDPKTKKMLMVGASRNNVVPSWMRSTEVVSYPANDGLVIPAYLTRPDDKAELKPAIVIIHGEPFERDYWRWDMDTQMLAQNGYVVLRPQIRGSYGFGKTFRNSGLQEWGLTMQDDIAAGVNYLVNEKIADPKRICIYGTGYGGYAAMWGLIKTPELYRCGISFGGVSDLSSMYKDWYRFGGDKELKDSRKIWIGDIESDQIRFDSTSPDKHGDQIKAPILIMHGEMDDQVPIYQSERMVSALKDNHKIFDWVNFPKEGHAVPAESKLYYETIFSFLEKYNRPDSTITSEATKTELTSPDEKGELAH